MPNIIISSAYGLDAFTIASVNNRKVSMRSAGAIHLPERGQMGRLVYLSE